MADLTSTESRGAPDVCRVCVVLEKENAWLREQVEVYRDQVASLADPLVLARVRVSVPPSEAPKVRRPVLAFKDELSAIERQKIEEAARPLPSDVEASFSSTEGA